MKNQIPKGYINRLHFIYIIVCLVLVIISILAITIWNKEDAGIGLNNAATASSIVLAVVAIVMTIVDIAGQRSTISDLRDTSETLESSLNQTNDNLQTLSELQDRLLKTMESISKSQEDLKNTISAVQKTYANEETISREKLNSDLESLKDKVLIMPRNNIKAHLRTSNYKYEGKNSGINERIFFVMSRGDEFSIADLLEEPAISSFDITRSELKNALRLLVNRGVLKNNNGKYSLAHRIKKAP